MLGVPEFLGHPLIKGDTLYATAASDLFFAWTPGGEWSFQRVHHPLPNLDIEVSSTARFGGYPPVLSSEGVIVGEDATHRFLATLTGHAQQRWHVHSSHTLGIPATLQKQVFTGYGGKGAVGGIMARDTETGQILWQYATPRLLPDAQKTAMVVQPKSVLVPKFKTVQAKSIATKRPVEVQVPIGQEVKQVSVTVPQPLSFDYFGHWSNSGLVLTNGKVYGEVNGTLVALNQETGDEVWTLELDDKEYVRSLVATPKHLICCISTMPDRQRQTVWEKPHSRAKHRLVALRLDNGKEVWQQEVPRPGNLAIADKRLFFTDGSLHVFGPVDEDKEEKVGETEIGESRKAEENATPR
jgi:outer membrane protein assembly factor BamB